MKLHRFYVDSEVELKHDFWLHDERLIHQWRKVLRFQPGQEVVLFDGITHDRLYRITEFSDKEAHLQHVTDFARKVPAKDVYLLWSLLKKDKNDWILQKCTELGVSHFIPLLADRCAKTDISHNQLERWKKIVIEAAEQCGRSDIPNVREALLVDTAIQELKNGVRLLVCEQTAEQNGGHEKFTFNSQFSIHNSQNAVGVLIGPEGGWSDNEKELFETMGIKHINLHDFTLRAETASIAAVSQLLK